MARKKAIVEQEPIDEKIDELIEESVKQEKEVIYVPSIGPDGMKMVPMEVG